MLLLPFFASAAAPEEAQLFAAAPGHTAVVLSIAPDARLPWVVFLPGSGCGLHHLPTTPWTSALLNSGWSANYAVLNKVGVYGDNHCDAAALQAGSLRPVRIADSLAALRQLPASARILLIGESEGAYIAPDVALADHRVQAVILISAGTRSWIDEEIAKASPTEQPAVARLFAQKIRGSHSLTDFYQGISYAAYTSFDTDQTRRSLQAIQIPVLMLNGDRDQATWVRATTEDARWLTGPGQKANIEFHLIAGADHGLTCVDPQACQAPALVEQVATWIRDFRARKF